MSLVRKASLLGRHGKPSIVIDSNMCVWLGNETSDHMTIQSQELFGFNTGSFDFRICERKLDSAGIPWRLLSDFSMIAVVGPDRSKTLVPLCKHLHGLATQQGLGNVEIREHEITPKLQPPAT